MRRIPSLLSRPPRAGFFAATVAACLACWLPLLTQALSAAAPSAGARRPPNLVMVFLDDMGWGDFSCFGNTEARTPNVDRLAAEGIRYSQFYVNAPICSPSRVGLSTGQYPQRWRITSFLNNRADNERRGMAQWLDPRAPMLARFLRQAGYATGHFGKWHMGGQRDVDDAPPISAYGFDASLTNFEGMGPKLLPLTLKPGDAAPGRIWADAERLGGPATWVLRSRITTGYVDAALAFIGRAAQEGRPFYINLWPDDVHSPFWPPVEKWRDTKRGQYLAVLEELDRQLGRFFERLRADPALRDNTLLLICSDNGPEQGAGSAGPFRGGKGTLFEGGIRSSLIVWGPGFVEPASVGTHNAASVFASFDLVPSLLRIARVQAPAGTAFDGEDVSEALLGRSQPSRVAPLFWRRPPGRRATEAEAGSHPDLAVREGRWKLLCEYDGSLPQLHDLDADRAEATNVAARHPEIVDRLRSLVLAWHAAMPPDKGAELGKAPEAAPGAKKRKKRQD